MSKKRRKKKVALKPAVEPWPAKPLMPELTKRELLNAIREAKIRVIELEKEFKRRFKRESGIVV